MKEDLISVVASDLITQFKFDIEKFRHSLRIAYRIRTFPNFDSDYILPLAALLHDVIEDTNFTIDDLKKLYYNYFVLKFGEENTQTIFHIVNCITRKTDETYFDYIQRVAKDEKTRIVKFFDIQDNLARCMLNNNSSLRRRYIKALKMLMK